MIRGITAGSHPKVCVQLVDPANNDFLQTAPGDWTAGNAPAGEVRILSDYAGTYANTANQGAFIDEGTACVTLTQGELQKETLIVVFRDASGCPSSCAYLTAAVYVQTISHPDAYHDATKGQ